MKWEKLKTIHRTVINTWRRNDGYSIVYVYESDQDIFSCWACQPNGKWIIKENDAYCLYRNKSKQKVLNSAMEWQKRHRKIMVIK